MDHFAYGKPNEPRQLKEVAIVSWHCEDQTFAVGSARKRRRDDRDPFVVERVEGEASGSRAGDERLLPLLQTLAVTEQVVLVHRIEHTIEDLVFRIDGQERRAIGRLHTRRENGDLLILEIKRLRDVQDNLGPSPTPDEVTLSAAVLGRPPSFFDISRESIAERRHVHEPLALVAEKPAAKELREQPLGEPVEPALTREDRRLPAGDSEILLDVLESSRLRVEHVVEHGALPHALRDRG